MVMITRVIYKLLGLYIWLNFNDGLLVFMMVGVLLISVLLYARLFYCKICLAVVLPLV